MKNVLLVSLSLMMVSVFPGCLKKNKGCENVPPASEASLIEAYCTTQGIVATKHPSGLYYSILDPGVGDQPNSASKIKATYTGKLLSGTVFDQMTTPPTSSWDMSLLIEGWRIGLPLIKEGGRIRMIIPSALGYGCGGAGPIPGNAILDFDVTLVDVTN